MAPSRNNTKQGLYLFLIARISPVNRGNLGGAVAFLDLSRDPAVATPAVAHTLSEAGMARVFRAENGLGRIPEDPGSIDLEPHQ